MLNAYVQKEQRFRKNKRMSKENPKKQEKGSREHESEGQTKGRSDRVDKQCRAWIQIISSRLIHHVIVEKLTKCARHNL